MIPIVVSAVSAASQIASPKTKQALVAATLVSVALIGFGIYRITHLLFKPAITFKNVEGEGSVSLTPDDVVVFDEEIPGPEETVQQQPILKQKVVSPPQANPPVSPANWQPTNLEIDSDIEERFYVCI